MTTSAIYIVVACYTCAVYLCLPGADAFRPPRSNNFFPSHPIRSRSFQQTTSTLLQSFKWPTMPSFATPSVKTEKSRLVVGERNGLDPVDYPWRFEGRFIFRPSFVRVTKDVQPPSSTLLSLFGYSLGGSVVLEYDVSPVGPYREYVTMGGVVASGKVDVGDPGKNSVDGRVLGLGQWGTDLYVSTQVAEDVCQNVWGVPAQVADIDFVEGGDVLADGPDIDEGGPKRFTLSGWENARILDNPDESVKRYGKIPIYWTPTIKALWAPLLFPGLGATTTSEEAKQLLPLHKLRLSASALRLKWCERNQSQTKDDDGSSEVPLGLALVVDNVLIEIGEQVAGNL